MISRPGRKRREWRAQTQPDHPFEVESCEYLTDGAFALLRVTGRGSVVPIALITQGDGPESFDPLPQPGEDVKDGVWQIAFALPTDVIEPGARVWLHDGGLYLADLLIPLPAEPEPEAVAVAEPAPEPAVEEQPAKKVVEAWSEAAQLRDKLAAREEELAEALKELLELRTMLEGAKAELAAAEQQRVELENDNKSRRAGISRRKEDRDARRKIAELEAMLGEREQRIEALEAQAGDAPGEQLAALEEDARQRAATNDDLRALLESERENAAAARREVEDLKQQLATVSAEYAAKVAEPARPTPRVAVKPSPSGVQSPPWSALDDELLARIEKAKAVTR